MIEMLLTGLGVASAVSTLGFLFGIGLATGVRLERWMWK